ncbi:major pollen allergen Lol p 11-like [Curcuma longa]|uniref:major pollen allergen Lol p 11-like n=1 Tax=Curcuma longa TaxID=136217 RepID=UPI003D9E238B
MANHFHASISITLLLAFFISIDIVLSASNIEIQGRAYCDTCRAGFETTATTYLEGAKVKLVCANFTTGEITYTSEATTDSTGTYHISVEHDHQEETCDIRLLKSSQSDCSEINEDRNRAPVVVTHNVGIASNVRYANSLGFLKDKPLPNCGQILMQYALGTEE